MVTVKKILPVTGLHCAACANNVETVLKEQKGVLHAGVNLANNTALIEFNPEAADLNEFKRAIQSIGYDIILTQPEGKDIASEIHQQEFWQLKKRTIWSTVLTLPVVILAMLFMGWPYVNWVMMVLTIPVLFWSGKSFFVNAIKQARHLNTNMDTLVALSTGTAFLFSAFNTIYPRLWHKVGLESHVYFEVAAVVVTFILLGKLLEAKAKSKTTAALKKLMGLQPDSVTVVRHDSYHEISLKEVRTGDTILVKPGDKVPVDGTVLHGNSFVDESMISGEPIPKEKNKNDTVFGGTVNQKGSFQFRAEKVGGETLLANIIKKVAEAQGSKAPIQKMVDKIAGIFVPVVIAISVLSFVGWMVAGGENALLHAVLAMETVLIIACPCAMGLATPTAIMVGIGKGAENGILIKDAESLEVAHRVNALVLDKTGTITEGKPEVSDLLWERGADEKYLKKILFALESKSGHPLADALCRHLAAEGTTTAIDEFQNVSGMGIVGKRDGKQFFAGNLKLMENNNIVVSNNMMAHALRFQKEAKTTIFFATETNAIALLAISDKISATAREAINRLKSLGIEVYMLTGDNAHTASVVASRTGILNYESELLPDDKAEFVKQLQRDGKTVAMAGDGINDLQALAVADVSIAMGKGSDIAIDTAGMTLISNDLLHIAMALKLSRQTVRTIRQNLFWAFVFNIIGIPVAAGILYPVAGFLLNPMVAGAAMALSSVFVVANSLRLKTTDLG